MRGGCVSIKGHTLRAGLALAVVAATLVWWVASQSPAKGASEASSSTLVLGLFQPFSGANANFGPSNIPDCYAAVLDINNAGGLLGHKVTCKSFDSTSDPADAVSAMNRMIASTSNLVELFGPPIDLPVESILDAAKLVHFSDDGDPRLDHQKSPYFFRFSPSDGVGGIVYALYAYSHGFTHAAAAFTNDQNAQTSVPALTRVYPKLGGHFAINLTLAPGQTSYRTEISRLLAAKPDAIIMEMDPQTAATFLTEVQQLDSGKLPPILFTSVASNPPFITAVSKAIGKTAYQQDTTTVQADVPPVGPGFNQWKHDLFAAPQQMSNRGQYLTIPYSLWYYDAYLVGALAMTQAKSTDPGKWAPLVTQIANGTPGAVVVHTYAEGKAALAAGKHIKYVGASGPILLNQWHNAVASWVGYKWNPTTGLQPTASKIAPSALARAEGL
jgi:branched-chain amino acid transport system substrate-binding protein